MVETMNAAEPVVGGVVEIRGWGHAVLAYGNKEVWLPQFWRWWESMRVSNPGVRPVVVTDGESGWVSEDVGGLRVVECPEANREVVRSELNMSGILMASAAVRLAPVLVTTLDCEVRGRLGSREWMRYKMAAGLDAYGQGWKFEDRREVVQERNVAVMWCGAREIGERFLKLWRKRVEDERSWKVRSWEQVVWSEVAADLGHEYCMMENGMNWSRMWPDGDERVVVYHRHGNAKWG